MSMASEAGQCARLRYHEGPGYLTTQEEGPSWVKSPRRESHKSKNIRFFYNIQYGSGSSQYSIVETSSKGDGWLNHFKRHTSESTPC